MGKLIKIRLADLPLEVRTKAASQLMVKEPGEIGPLMLAALAPSDNTYSISEKSYLEWTRKRSASRR